MGRSESVAQQESNHWYFGVQAGIDFSSGSPVSVSGGQTQQWEGVGSISDANGNFLFYTDGVSVWDKNHDVMPNGNGLDGDYSSTQSALVVPQPGNPGIFYVFTVDNEAGPDGFRYSTVDMALNSGLGDVVDKNVLVYTPTTEKIGAVKHKNDEDIWIVTHEWNSNNFRSYLLSSSGLSSNPVTSSAGSIISGNMGNTIGYLKFNPQRCKMVCAIFSSLFFELYDFDDETGIVSNALTFPANYDRVYGMEFSPDGTKLYTATNGDPSNIWQYDITSGTVSGILATEYLVGSYSGLYSLGALQLGPDNKIYCGRNGQPYLDVINNPNGSGSACDHISNGFALTSGTSQLGLPTFFESFFYTSDTLVSQINCLNTPSEFEIPGAGATYVQWNFGDPISGNDDTTSGYSVQHLFSDTGDYEITAYLTFVCYLDTLTQNIHVSDLSPSIDLGNDSSICQGESLVLNAYYSGSSYLWQDGSTDSTLQAIASGLYYVTVTNSCGSDIDSINIIVDPLPSFTLGVDTAVCTGTTLLLSASVPNASYLWQDGSSSSSFLVNQPGIYWLQVTNNCGSISDTIEITSQNLPSVNLGNDTVVCDLSPFVLSAFNPFCGYLWQDGSTNSTFQVNSSGLFYVTVTNSCGSDQDSVEIEVISQPFVDFGPDSFLCVGGSIVLGVSDSNSNIQWQDGSTDSIFTITQSGIYWVQLSNQCGVASDTIEITSMDAPIVDLGPDSTFCSASSFILDAANSNSIYLWQDGSSAPSYNASSSGLYWVIVTNNCGIETDSINLNFIATPSVNLGADFIVCDEDTALLDTNNPGAQFLWQDGSTQQTFTVNKGGTYWVTVQFNSLCKASDTISVAYLKTPSVDLGNDTTVCFGEATLTLSSIYEDSSYYFTWQDGSHSSNLVADQSGIYALTASNFCGSDQDTIEVKYVDCSCDLFVPNAFSPNGDGINDFFHPIYLCPVNEYDLEIFDRWGELTFQTNDIEQKWDGTYNGESCELDVYVYMIHYTNSKTGLRKLLKGNVTLVQ